MFFFIIYSLIFSIFFFIYLFSPSGTNFSLFHPFKYTSAKRFDTLRPINNLSVKPRSHCAGVATVHPDAGQPVYRDAPGHIS